VTIRVTGLPLLLTIIFVVLKLVGAIAWSWWLVFLPLIIGAGIFAIVLVILLLAAILTK